MQAPSRSLRLGALQTYAVTVDEEVGCDGLMIFGKEWQSAE
jgi:hypothetical protein